MQALQRAMIRSKPERSRATTGSIFAHEDSLYWPDKKDDCNSHIMAMTVWLREAMTAAVLPLVLAGTVQLDGLLLTIQSAVIWAK